MVGAAPRPDDPTTPPRDIYVRVLHRGADVKRVPDAREVAGELNSPVESSFLGIGEIIADAVGVPVVSLPCLT